MSVSRRAATFTLSLDLELAWGSWQRPQFDDETFALGADYARRLDLLARELRLPMTWGVVGSLYDLTPAELCDLPPDASVAAARPDLGPFSAPLPTVSRVLANPTSWFAADLVQQLATSPAGHELATHTYFHATPDTAEGLVRDLHACAAALPEDRRLTTIIFPRDLPRHLDALTASGVSAYRAPGAAWYYQREGRRPVAARMGHTLAQVTGRRAAIVAVNPQDGAVRMPSSGILTLRYGLRRRIPAAVLRRRFVGPLDTVVREGGIYHLWTHPWNLGLPGSDAFDLLAEVCQRAASLRDRGDLAVRTMAELSTA